MGGFSLKAERALVVLAAGVGSRYGGFKQLDPVGPDGSLVLEYSIFDALRSGFSRVVFVIRPETEEAFRAVIGRRIERHVPVAFVAQRMDDLPADCAVSVRRVKPWGTAHALFACRKMVREPFGVVNADDFYGRGSFEVMGAFFDAKQSALDHGFAMVAFRLGETLSEHGAVARGICEQDANGRLKSVEEMTEIARSGKDIRARAADGHWRVLPDDTPVSMNMWAFTPALFAFLEDEFRLFLAERGADAGAEWYLPSVVAKLVARQLVTVEVLPSTEKWCGVTYQADRAGMAEYVSALAARGVYPVPLWGRA